MIDLINKSFEFARELIGSWSLEKPCNAEHFQQKYLYSNSHRAWKTAEVFWRLREQGDFHEGHILARILLERIVLGRLAAISPERACGLIAAEIREEIAGIERWLRFGSDDPKVIGKLTSDQAKSVNLHLNEKRTEAEKFAQMGGQSVSRWNMAAYMREIGEEWMYRSAYRDLSNYSHANFWNSIPGASDVDASTNHYIALLVVPDTALSFYGGLRNRQIPEEIADRFKSLKQEFMNKTIWP